MLSLELIRQKFKTYSKRNRFRRILSNPSLKVYYDAALYRNLIPEGLMVDDIYLFPDGTSIQIEDNEKPADVTAGRLRLGTSGDADEASYRDRIESNPSILESAAEVFSTMNWGIVAVFTNTDWDGDVPSALFDMSNDDGGYCRLEMSSEGQLRFFYKGSDSVDELASLVHDVNQEDDVYMFASMSEGNLKVYFNGVLALDETVGEEDYAALEPLAISFGGILDGLNVGTTIPCQLCMFALFSDSLNSNEKSRYDAHVSLFYPNFTFEEAVVEPPMFTVGAEIEGTARVGFELSLNEFAYEGEDVDVSYQWFVASPPTPISGATSSTFILTEDELADEIYCVITLTNRGGTTETTTPAVGPVIAA